MFNVMKRLAFKSIALTAASLGLISMAAATQASAACLDDFLHQGSPSKGSSAPHFVPAVYRADSGATFLPANNTAGEDATIVGLWQFKLDGFAVDWGTQAWHSDGTEIMFSGGQNPETGDVCQGVWRKVGRSTYTLNHIAMGWTAPGGSFGLRIHFHMVVKLDASGNAFSGKYTVAVYSVGPTDPFDESVEVASGTGSVTATRVTPD
jgi:hypothetical protein